MALPSYQVGRPVEHAARAVVIVDVVESVRLVEEDQDGVVRRWLQFVEHVDNDILPDFSGNLVKGLGDGMLLEFGEVRSAMSAAFAIQKAIERENRDISPEKQLLLRMGIEAGDVIVEKNDVFGRGVNMASRLATLAGPGEIVVSAAVRGEITPVLDAEIEDLGECFLKHIKDPVRAYRVGPPGPHPAVMPSLPLGDLRPTLAIVPFSDRTNISVHHFFGEIVAEELIRTLSQSHELNVISRLSTTALRDRGMNLAEISGHLNANYVLSGSYRVVDLHFGLDLELADAKSGQVIWVDRLDGRVDEVISGQRELIHHVVAGVSAAIESREVSRAQSQALPNLESYTLLLGAIGLMHHLSLRDFEEAHRLLETLIERASRQSLPLAWLGKWHVLRVQQGWSEDPQHDARRALQCTTQALDADPHCALALAVDGIVHTNLLKRLDIAQDRYELAIETNPSESLAWLLKGTLHAFRGEGRQAVLDTERAGLLSPLDPHRYFYDSLAATAYLSAHQYDRALEYAKRSLRANRTHTSTLRAIAVAQLKLGRADEARETTAELMSREPTLTVSGWLERSPSSDFQIGQEWAEAFRELGVPA